MKGSCYICGGDAADTRDHVFPKGLFPRPLPTDMLTAPACADCQQRLQADEEYFRTFAAASSYPDPKAKELWDGKIVRSFANSPAFRARLAKGISMREWRSREGVILGNLVVLEGERTRIGNVLWKIVRGLSYLENGDVMPFDVKFNFSQISPITDPLPDEVMDIIHATPLRTVGDAVRYKFAQRPEDLRVTISWLAFYGLAMFLVWTWPQDVELGGSTRSAPTEARAVPDGSVAAGLQLARFASYRSARTTSWWSPIRGPGPR